MANKTSQPQSTTPELIFVGHSDAVTKLVFSPNGKWLVSAANDGRIIVWDVKTREMVRVIAEHISYKLSVDISQDGKLLVTSDYRTVILWDVATWQPLWSKSIKGKSLIFIPNSSLIAVNREESVELWDVMTGRCIRKIIRYKDNLYIPAIAVSSDGSTLATSIDNSISDSPSLISLWDIVLGKLIRTWELPKTLVESLSFSPEGKQLALIGEAGLYVWDVASGTLLAQPQFHHLYMLGHDLCYSPNGEQIATGWLHHSIHIFEAHTGELVKTLSEIPHSAMSLAYSPDGLSLAINGNYGTIELWDIQTETQIGTFSTRKQPIGTIVIDNAGKQLAFSIGNRKISIWDLATANLKTVLKIQDMSVCGYAFSPDGHFLASAGRPSVDKSCVWEIKTSDGKTLASGRCVSLTTLYLWDIKTSEITKTGKSKRDINSVSFSPDGNSIATGIYSGTVRLWNTATLTPKRSWRVGSRCPAVAIFSPTWQSLATFTGNRVTVWNVQTRKKSFSFACPHNEWPLQNVKFSPDGTWIAFTSEYRAYAYDLRSGQPRCAVQAAGEGLAGLSISSDGTRIATSAHYDRRICIANSKTGALQRTIYDHPGLIFAIEFLPGTNVLASLATDNAIKLWNSQTGKLLLTLASFETDNPDDDAWIAFTPKGYYNASPNIAKHIRWRVGTEVLPGDTYAETYYRPDLVSDALQIGKRTRSKKTRETAKTIEEQK